MAGQPFRRINALMLAVLVQLRQRPMHPYEISRTLQESGRDSSVRISFGALYNAVEILLRQRLIEIAGAEREGNRPVRTIYRITEAGTQEMRDWLRAWLSEPEREFPRYRAALSFLNEVGSAEETARLLRHRVASLEKRIAELDSDLCSATQQSEFICYERHMLVADRTFTAQLAARVESYEPLP
ncbi:PadR family transcriptional regulator [Nocardia sp. CDC153]|uniref:PadR family transcriptional regulator n=1 Tax=Nocardia sp. CDC153 TaxID=3112167 RepID=UPI002DB7B279|nr:PadR family transcriptional regulator [Nocardia sp. CDC153]MEC3952002.1 PadR family transcriptional regulator [Nocardia sp. CDC153]